jgi:hypothetical protein
MCAGSTAPCAWAHCALPPGARYLARPPRATILSSHVGSGRGADAPAGSLAPARSLARRAARYVRREVRDLTDTDRDAILDAMRVMYKTPLVEGRKTYGADFVDAGYIAAVHNAWRFCYHGEMHRIFSTCGCALPRSSAAPRRATGPSRRVISRRPAPHATPRSSRPTARLLPRD